MSGESMSDDLRAALAPFLKAAAIGFCVEGSVNDAKVQEKGLTKLLAFGGYAGQYAAESRVSWADWKRLLDAADDAGLLSPSTPQVTV